MADTALATTRSFQIQFAKAVDRSPEMIHGGNQIATLEDASGDPAATE